LHLSIDYPGSQPFRRFQPMQQTQEQPRLLDASQGLNIPEREAAMSLSMMIGQLTLSHASWPKAYSETPRRS